MNLFPTRLPPALLSLLLVTGCTGPIPKPHAPEPPVIHLVLCWLQDPGNADHQRRIIERTKSFRYLPGVLDLQVGASLPSDRGIVDDSFDVGVYLRFEGVEAMNRYLADPLHVQAVQEVFKPLCKTIRAHDFSQS